MQDLIGKDWQQRGCAANRTANKSSVIVASITFLLNTNFIPAAKLRHVLCILPLARLFGAGELATPTEKTKTK